MWEDTDRLTNLHDRRVRTKTHEGGTFVKDNTEFLRILMAVFTSTTLNNAVKSFQATTNGLGAWNAILVNVQGGSYITELKRQGDAAIDGAFFDPSKNFTFEKYFDKHVRSHELHAEAGAVVPEWGKVDLFCKRNPMHRIAK